MNEKPRNSSNPDEKLDSGSEEKLAQTDSEGNVLESKKKPYRKPVLRKCFQIDQVSAYGV